MVNRPSQDTFEGHGLRVGGMEVSVFLDTDFTDFTDDSTVGQSFVAVVRLRGWRRDSQFE